MANKNYQFKFKSGDVISCFHTYSYGGELFASISEPLDLIDNFSVAIAAPEQLNLAKIKNKEFTCLVVDCLLHPNGSRYKLMGFDGVGSNEPKFFIETNFYKLGSLDEEQCSILFG